MSFNQRSTNERVLARHRFKRLPQADHIAAGASSIASVLANPVAGTPIVSVLPAFGTNSPPSVTSLLTTSEVATHTGVPSVSPVVSTSNPSPSVSTRSPDLPSSVTTPSVTPSVTPSAPPVTPSVIPSATPSSVPPSSSSSASMQVASSSSPSSTATGNRIVSSATPSPSAAASNASASSKSGLSPGAVSGIVAVIMVFAALVVGFFLRRRSRHRRNMRRNTWGAGLVPTLESKRETVYAEEPFTGQSMAPSGGVPDSERLTNVPRTTFMSQTQPPQGMPALPAPTSSYNPTQPPQGMPALAAPTSSYNPSSPISPFVAASVRAPSIRSSTVSNAAAPVEFATVARTFIPSLPDELQIANGEQICILNAYDDGWALCANFRGDRGVVPLECLDRSTRVSPEMQLQPQSEFSSDSNKTLRRMSSLAPDTTDTY